MAPNFTECSIKFLNSSVPYYNYTYNGSVSGIFKSNALRIFNNRSVLISVDGCRHLCHTGNDYYPWKDAAATITTWVLPVIGLLLQAPYESNEFWRTFWALVRWTGSPVASLSYILWNIKVTSKCALIVDMATTYEEIPGQNSQFAQIRDSFYILSVMNQYSMKQRMPAVTAEAAEKLIRTALFSDSLQLTNSDDRTHSLVKRRCQLANVIRRGRKKGVVPVFITLMWFLFSLAISIQAAWGQYGSNAEAHNMALGFLLSWLPILILTSIVDRNPVAANSILLELNCLLDDVRSALSDPELRTIYIRDTGGIQEDFAWINNVIDEEFFRQGFFTQFAGQGRVRWHYGVAHPILEGIERTFMAEDWGRNWLRNASARTLMVKGPDRPAGLRHFDFRMIWQIMSSVCLVYGTVGGAFILSYWTPTVGLGCRSGGYLIFVVVALGIFAAEFLVWWLIEWAPEGHTSRMESNRSRLIRAAKDKLSGPLDWWGSLTLRDRIEIFVLRPLEIGNFTWLVYIVIAQTFGFYQNCNCMASIWGGQGGYLDFETYDSYRQYGVKYYWGFGIAVSCAVMAIGFAFVVTEYCVQSHLSTEEYANAVRGLMRTRRFKKYAHVFRDIPEHLIAFGKFCCHKIFGRHIRDGRRSLVWTWKTKSASTPLAVNENTRLHISRESRSEDGSFLDGIDIDDDDIDVALQDIQLDPM
ncbi:hypothetical protein MMC07_008236 [Pseudocyphellaria aurata]|nr:hypothetical protein [Pseudocyphellaria aurata]